MMWAPSTLLAKPVPQPSMLHRSSSRDPGCWPGSPLPPVLPTHQLNALGERIVLPVLLRKALQDVALAFPTP